MTVTPSLSVVVASHGRPAALRRCLLALGQSSLAPLDAVVVADKEGLEAVAGLPFADRIRTVLQAEPNLSQARNDGIAHAAGDIVAFLDDDAVPEPTWAARVAGAFTDRARPRGGHGAGPRAERHLASVGTPRRGPRGAGHRA
jgi:glycosyltransferase involved in cell wall biosynthesis